MYRIAVLVLFLCTLCASGCAVWNGSAKKYQTIVANPNRDEKLAIKKTHEAQKAHHKGHLEKAEQLLQEALIADVQYGPAHNNLGLVYLDMGKYYQAAWEFEYAIRTLGDRPEPLNNMGMVLEAADKLDEAVDYYSRARMLAPENPEYTGNLARSMMKRNERDPALRDLLTDLMLDKTRPEWAEWASERLATGKFDPPSQPAKASDIETVPTPPLRPPTFPEMVIPHDMDLPPP